MEQLTFVNLGMEIYETTFKEDKGDIEVNYEEKGMVSPKEMISGTKAMQLLEFSRHTFDKLVKDGIIKQYVEGKKKYYILKELQEFMKTEEYKQLSVGTVDKRNNLNDLTGKDWLPETKSFFYQKGLGANHLLEELDLQPKHVK